MWERVRRTLTLGGGISFGVLVTIVAALIGWISGQITMEVERRLPLIKEEASSVAASVAASAATAAVKDDIRDIERVRQAVSDHILGLVPEMITQALAAPDIRAKLIQLTEEETKKTLNSPERWRSINRELMALIAGKKEEPLSSRLLAFDGLVIDLEGRQKALELLASAAAAMQERGLGTQDEAALFLRSALARYAAVLGSARPVFADHEGLLFALARLVDESNERGNAFEALMHRFDDAVSIAALLRRTRNVSSLERRIMLSALVSHPGLEAKERVDQLLCAHDENLRTDLLSAINSRPGSLIGDEHGRKFVHFIRCLEPQVRRQRLPVIAQECFPDDGLSDVWELRTLAALRSPTRAPSPISQSWLRERDNERASVRRRDIESRLSKLAEKQNCPDWRRVTEAPRTTEARPTLRDQRGWSTFGAMQNEAVRTRMLGLELLLPDGRDHDTPGWLSALAEGSGAFAEVLESPARHWAHFALLLERLSRLDSDQAQKARRQVLSSLVRAGASPGHEPERLLLELMTTDAADSASDVCDVVFDLVTANPPKAIEMPAAFAEALRCLRPEPRQRFPDPRMTRLLEVIGWLETRARVASDPRTSAKAERVRSLAALALGGSPGDDLLGLMLSLVSPTVSAEDSLLAAAWRSLLSPSLVRDLERNATHGSGVLRAGRENDLIVLARQRPEAFAPWLEFMPYLNDAFERELPGVGSGRPPLDRGGRHWASLTLSDTDSYTLADDVDGDIVVLQTNPFRVFSVRAGLGAWDTGYLSRGNYIIGTTDSVALQALRRRERQPEFDGHLRREAGAEALRIGVRITSRLGPEGARWFPYLLETGKSYEFVTSHLEGDLDTVIKLYGPQDDLLAENDDYIDGQWASRICIDARHSGLHWLEVSSFDRPPRQRLLYELRASELGGCTGR